MTSIVTGGAGFIGSHLVDALGDALVVDPRAERDDDIPHRMQEVWYTDLPARIDAVYHLASPVGPVGVLEWAGRLAFEVANCAYVAGTWALRYRCPLVFVSTSEVYGTHDAPTGETDPCVFQPEASARKEYAVAKLAAETMLLNTVNLDVRIVRPFNVAGPRQKTDGGFVIPRFIEQAKTGAPLTVYGDGSPRRSFTHVADVVDGLILAAEHGRPGEVYNLGNPDNECSIAQLAADVIAVTGSSSVIEYVDPVTLWGPAFREAADKVPDSSKAKAEFGWNPTRDRLQIIRDAAA